MSIEWSNPISRRDGGGNLHSVQSFRGLRVVVLEGDGSSEDPVRRVMHYFDEHGNHIGEPIDPSGPTNDPRPDPSDSAGDG